METLDKLIDSVNGVIRAHNLSLAKSEASVHASVMKELDPELEDIADELIALASNLEKGYQGVNVSTMVIQGSADNAHVSQEVYCYKGTTPTFLHIGTVLTMDEGIEVDTLEQEPLPRLPLHIDLPGEGDRNISTVMMMKHSIVKPSESLSLCVTYPVDDITPEELYDAVLNRDPNAPLDAIMTMADNWHLPLGVFSLQRIKIAALTPYHSNRVHVLGNQLVITPRVDQLGIALSDIVQSEKTITWDLDEDTLAHPDFQAILNGVFFDEKEQSAFTVIALCMIQRKLRAQYDAE